MIDLQHAVGVHGRVVQLVASEWSTGPIAQCLFLAYLATEDSFADVGEVAVALLGVDRLEKFASVYHFLEVHPLGLFFAET